MSRHLIRTGLVGLLVLLLGAGPAAADFKALLKRIPGEANVLVVCDVEKIMQSPLAVKEGWAAQRSSAYARQPMLVPPEAVRVAMAGLINFQEFDTIWEVSVIEMAKPRSIESIAKGEGGFVDRVADASAAFSPLDAYFIELAPGTLGVVAPANRQFAARWLREKQTLAGAFASSYLRLAAAAAERGTEFVLAVDLEDVIAAPRVARRLREETWSSLENQKYDLKTLCELLASAKGMTLNVEIGDAIRGTAKFEFGQDTAPIVAFAQPLLLELLDRLGAQVEGLDKWEAKAARNTLTFQGPLTTEGFMRLASIVQPPRPQPVAMAEAPPGRPPAGQDQPPAQPAAVNPAAASVEYYRAIDRMMSKLGQSIGSGAKSASLAQSASWMRRDARRINQLPILNVDPDLIAFGSEVATGLVEIANICSSGGQRTREGTEAIQTTYTGGYGYDNPYPDQQAAADRMNADKQRREVVAREKAAAMDAAGQVLQGLRAAQAQIRVAMTQKYNVEF
ncbi:MAG: hypothetical protein AB1716_06665 [Planctomycetota bacterium]